MGSFFELFQPGLRFQREQRDLEKMLVVEDDKGGTGPRRLDLDSGKIVLRMPAPKGPAAPDPDDKDWTWVLEQPCRECSYLGSEIDHGDLPRLVRAAAAPWASVLGRADAAVRPSAKVWSPLEYGCHVRDVLLVFSERLALMLAEDDPVFANWDQDATAIAERYWAADPAQVAAEIAAAAQLNADGWAGVTAEQWERPGRRSNGSVFTVDSLGRYFLHDLRHHLHDVGA